ncbi:MAG: hypothetical protein KJO11_00025 [Gemmatimonadetes bacterium]|nr:hypothetical protein [Gemmatimonadota bacterium]
MADLKIIAELTPPPHNACRLGFDDRAPLWLGFQPAYDMSFGAGRIETRSREHEHHHFVRFEVESDEVLARARHMVFREWKAGAHYSKDDISAQSYIPFVRDCITFARDVAQACGLRAPAWDDVLDSAWHDHWLSRIDFLPQELLVRLYHYNEDRVLESNLLSPGVSVPKKEP